MTLDKRRVFAGIVSRIVRGLLMALIRYRSNAQKRWSVQERVIVVLIANIFVRGHCLPLETERERERSNQLQSSHNFLAHWALWRRVTSG